MEFVFVVLVSLVGEKEKVYNYEAESIFTALANEGIEFDENNYVSNDKQVKMYLFRGHGCSHCYEFLEYVNDELIKKYKKKITFEIYETWEHADNAKLMSKVGKLLGDDATGVPYIIIGDKSWIGYDPSWNEEITNQIDLMYSQEVEERYDIMDELNKAE